MSVFERRIFDRTIKCSNVHFHIFGNLPNFKFSALRIEVDELDHTFTEYIRLEQCCFIPGRLLDEIWRVLRLVQRSLQVGYLAVY